MYSGIDQRQADKRSLINEVALAVSILNKSELAHVECQSKARITKPPFGIIF